MNNFGRRNWFLIVLIGVLMMVLVMAGAPDWINGASDVNYTTIEDSVYYHNFSANITGYAGDVEFEIAPTDSQRLFWTNGSGTFNFTTADIISDWIVINDAPTGNFTINAIYDNQTGFFEIPIKATNTTEDGAIVESFEFQVNATNDVPVFSDLLSDYNFTQNEGGSYVINAVDEESHYPLYFNLTFIGNCTHASWADRNPGENCSVFELTDVSSTATSAVFTPVRDEVGTYWANLTAMDYGENYSCPHIYCDNDSYEVNKTSVVSLVRFDVLASLAINVTNCTGENLEEDVEFNCTIEITTPGAVDDLNISSVASFGNGYSGSIENESWFYADTNTAAVDFVKQVNISFIPTEKEVGNWSINFTVDDYTQGLFESAQIDLFVNWTEENVTLELIPNFTVYEDEIFTVNGYDNDLLIQDKWTKDEDLTFTSNTSWVSFVSDSHTVGTNYTTATFEIDYDSIPVVDVNYSILINVTDDVIGFDSQVFRIEILNDTAPEWNQTEVYVFVSDEDDNVYINLTDGYVSDAEGDLLNFTYINYTQFDNFSLTGVGIIDFNSSDVDVGYHNITIIANDSKRLTSHEFNFTIFNVGDFPNITEIDPNANVTPSTPFLNGSSMTAVEDTFVEFDLDIDDYDFLIPNGQTSFYDEVLTIDVIATNSTGGDVDLFEFYSNGFVGGEEHRWYKANFTPDSSLVGNYTVFVNISDVAGNLENITFEFNITDVDDLPNLTFFDNQSSPVGEVFYLDINGTDEEDDAAGRLLNYTLSNLTVGGDFLTINLTSGEINVTPVSANAGYYEYNVSVNDSAGQVDSQIFSLTVYGAPNITLPLSSYEFDWTEASATGDLDFEVDYDVNNTNLTYKFYMDNIVYSNSTAFNYTNLTMLSDDNLRNTTNFVFTDEVNFTWNFIPSYTDETYGMLKNLTLLVYNPNYPNLNSSVNWKVNVSHANAPVQRIEGTGIGAQQADYNSNIEINLSNYFSDEDVDDPYYDQNLTVVVAGDSRVGSLSDDWDLVLSNIPKTAFTTYLNISVNDSSTSDSISNVEIIFTDPSVVVVTTPSSGGGTTTKLKHYSLKLIVPQNVIIESDEIEIPFSVQNNGQIDLLGINLGSSVLFNDLFSDDVRINLGDGYIPELKFGQSENFTMKISANTQKAGKYKATISANVTTPKFSDYADFFIEIMKANESEAEQILIFTEKFVAENSECLELTELLKVAQSSFDAGDFTNSARYSTEVIEACEDAIQANDQIKYKVEGFVRDNFYYISFVTLLVFFMGFIFYVYRRVRFNKSEANEYV